MKQQDRPEADETFDLIILGAGAAGLAAAKLAASQGVKLVLIEEDKIGGECFNVGCIPSKTIIRTSRLYADMKNAENFGGEVPKNIEINFENVMMRMRRIRNQISEHITVNELQKEGIRVYSGHAEFSSRSSIHVNGKNLQFGKCIIAVGASPTIPDIPGLNDVDCLTNENIFNLQGLPESMLVIGGGSIGCELAQAFCRLGSKVSIVQISPMFLDNVERDGAQILSDALAEDGVSIYLNSTVLKIQKAGNKKIVDIESSGNKTTIVVTDILVSVGQTPNTQNLNLDAAGITMNDKGFINADEFFCTSNPDVFVVGAVCDGDGQSHIPVAAARCATQNALFKTNQTMNATATAWCIYTDPEIAHIGLQVTEARTKSIPVKTVTILMHQVDRAIADSEDRGFVKIHVKEGTDKILGGTIVSRHAGDIINALCLAMSADIGLYEFAKAHFPYPTQGDVIKIAAQEMIDAQARQY